MSAWRRFAGSAFDRSVHGVEDGLRIVCAIMFAAGDFNKVAAGDQCVDCRMRCRSGHAEHLLDAGCGHEGVENSCSASRITDVGRPSSRSRLSHLVLKFDEPDGSFFGVSMADLTESDPL